ncbi:VIT1/CCC1 transporter family protein [Aquicella lusitana]|uniref:VIT1/CCC1 family predicted Fe2+/Mn2+ transporter n=1 Tax=Aquicella lusitana TaxID=254246 RepID=A0A370GJF0_9COXI|nr:VIT1/CCC1 transporter family protein [Aquicella lusitana]RDI42063.1 VIT1/CCC1 family predicted Fe2+/Mn2+ transporter [Aquicella lusitana]VVC74430.1 hypothetical protein AQULUS_21960 [Aquicella lusitana]
MPHYKAPSPASLSARLVKIPAQSYLRDWIYGGIDGTVTTFAVVSGVVGGQLSPLVILILGFANLLADGFSMAASNYLGTKSESEQYQHYKAIESNNIETAPQVKKNDIKEIFSSKGVEGNTLDKVTDAITANKSLWIDTLLREQYGLPMAIRSPYKAALYTFCAFVLFGLVPLLPYVFSIASPFFWSCLLTGVVFFVIGSVKSHWSLHSWLHSGVETLAIGAITAFLAYIIGWLLRVYLTT